MTSTETETAGAVGVTDAELRRIEQFLYRDADLLDDWKLHEWLARFSADAHYLVPSTDLPTGDPDTDLMLVSDDRFLLEQRVNSLLTRAAHAEYPHSRTRRMISNIRASQVGGPRDLREVTANFALYRTRPGVLDTYVGRYRMLLAPDAEHEYVFVLRRAELVLDSLRPHGKLSVIL
ncbi:aromatic-ring-hydroxylating dioxygenase subunit beta [Pseudonocardia sp. CA-107938]|uniref:aromatic-ring-hydroxylating dioxygenase subunit beta n=1 Tax=Pseudonocardia sp. CA-107938 TaxID=3240021 RepID=UPI003D9088C5